MKQYTLGIVLLLSTLDISANQEIQKVDSMVQSINNIDKKYEKKIALLEEKNRFLREENSQYKSKIERLKAKKRTLHCAKRVENQFPKLKMKKEIYSFKAAAFRLKEDAPVYAGVNSEKIIAKWEKGTSFTSHISSNERVKITGYFIDKIWRKADKNMWIENSKVIKR
jgi:hypothetical protein